MQQHLGRQAGVAKVEVNLLDGKVLILLKEDVRFDPRAVLKAAFDSGITVEEMTITAQGELERSSGKLLLRINPAQSFEVAPEAASGPVATQAGSGVTVTARGLLYKKSKDTRKKKEEPVALRLYTLELLPKEGGQ